MARKPLSKRPSKKTKEEDTLEKQRLELEVKEREWNVVWGKFIPLLTPIILASSIVVSGYWYTNQWKLQNEQQMLETKRLRQETITNLKKELASDNSAIRIGAAIALSEYPKEAVPVLISSLGNADIAFTSTVKHSLLQIGKDAVTPLIEELRNTQRIIEDICSEDINLKEPSDFPFDLDDYVSVLMRRHAKNIEKPASRYSIILRMNTYTLLNKPEELRDRLRNLLPPPFGNLSEKAIEVCFPREEVEYLTSKLYDASSSKPELKILWKNILEILGFLLCKYDIKNLDLSFLDLSGIDLRGAGLSGALLLGSNLSNACLNFVDLSGVNLDSAKLSGTELMNAKLSGAQMASSNLSQANLRKADLSGANLQWANLSGTFLNGANLTGANLSDSNLSNAVLWKHPFGAIGVFALGHEKLTAEDETKLAGTNLERANLTGVAGFRDIVDFNKTNLKGVTGLSKEDLEYAKSKGATID